MKRIDAIRNIMFNISEQTIVVSSVGMISREVFAVKDRDRNFYVQGSMGSALGIGLGIALNTDVEVIVISGDASALMSMGTFVLHNKLRPKNLKHYILDNNISSSTGGQPTCSDMVDFSVLACNTEVFKVNQEKGDAPRITLSPNQIARRFKNAICIDCL